MMLNAVGTGRDLSFLRNYIPKIDFQLCYIDYLMHNIDYLVCNIDSKLRYINLSKNF